MRALKSPRSFRLAATIVLALMAVLIGTVRKVQCANLDKPLLLVANPEMGDPTFQRSVILMVPTTDPPALAGVIINEPSRTQAREIFPDSPALKDGSSSVFYGGPVEGPPTLLFRTSHPPAKATQVFEDVYVVVDRKSIAEIVKNPAASSDLRLVIGRAQWKRDQLEGEIEEGAWYVAPPNADQVFSAEPKKLWHQLAERGQLEETLVAPLDEFAAIDAPSLGILLTVTIASNPLIRFDRADLCGF